MNETPVRTPAWRRIMSFCLVLVLLAALVPASALKAEAAGNITVYFQDNWKWQAPRIHYWGGGVETTWPGKEMTKIANDGTYDIYKCVIPAGSSCIFSDYGNNQSPNITDVADGDCYYMYFDNGNKAYEGIYLKGSFNGWTDANPMTMSDNGIISITLTLSKGTYDFKVQCIGDWYG